MDKVTQANAARAEESASASEELNAQAESLKDSVRRLVEVVDGAKGNAASSASLAPTNVRAQHGRSHSSRGSKALAPAAHESPSAPAILAAPSRGVTALKEAASSKEAAIPLETAFKDF
jgi:methyl-accepting chemotaxis protein